jgi:pyridoxamine 5'-phosphate oxidase
MTKQEIMSEVDVILDESKTAVLATADKEGQPHMRWMTPCILKDRKFALYAITSPNFEKVRNLEENSLCEWIIQTPRLDTVVTLRGMINLVDNQSLKGEVIENIGPRLSMFWKLNENQSGLLVLETIIREGMYFKPMLGSKIHVKFS